jgi:alkylhydroperoxidase/carboxymuconolactone decarboxylase family protein YurZ
MVDLPSRPLAVLDPEFERMALETGSLTYGLTGTNFREKLLQNLANDICRLHLGLAFRLHVQAALGHGIPYADLLALIRFVAPYAGYPASADALARLGELAVELGADTSAAASQRDPADTPEPDRYLNTTDAWMASFLASRIERAWSEGALSRRELAFVALTADVALQTLGASFRTHVTLALDSGANPDAVRDAVRFTAEMGIAKAAAGLSELDAVLSTLDARATVPHRPAGTDCDQQK